MSQKHTPGQDAVIGFWENRGTPVFDDEAPNGQIIGYNDVTTGSKIFPNAEAAYDYFDPETMNSLTVKAIKDLPQPLAAAPELLEALKTLVAALDAPYPIDDTTARAAIAKAEGRK